MRKRENEKEREIEKERENGKEREKERKKDKWRERTDTCTSDPFILFHTLRARLAVVRACV